MPRVKKFNSSNKYKGKYRSTTRPSDGNSTAVVGLVQSPAQTQKSSSSKKLSSSKLPKDYTYDVSNVNIIVNVPILSDLIRTFTKCKTCNGTDCITVRIDENYQNGLSHKIIVECNKCDSSSTSLNSKIIRNKSELNIRHAYALRSIGRGIEAGKIFSAVMNLAPPNARLHAYFKNILPGAIEVCNASMRNAALEAIEENDGSRDIAAAFDGTWQKRGHTSRNGVITVTSFDTGKVLDFECYSKFCITCSTNKISDPEKIEQHKEVCGANYQGASGGMEVAGAKTLCNRSEEKLGLRYTKYLGDGDSKGFMSVLESKPYGNNVEIKKLECVGHIQKRLGTRLRNLKKSLKKVKLSDGRPIGGIGRLTDAEIDNLQRYYGLAIRRNLSDVESMENAVWATYLHKMSTDDNAQHHLCPEGNESWCKYNKYKDNNISYHHTKSLPMAVMLEIEPIYEDLTQQKLLERCLHGRTQNPNESFNNCIWRRIPKTDFVSLKTMELGVRDAVICFNEGSIAKVHVLLAMGITPGKFMVEGLKIIDRRRILRADKETKEQNKKKRIRRRLLQKSKDEKDETEATDYLPGGF
jgi:hypothetical protein